MARRRKPLTELRTEWLPAMRMTPDELHDLSRRAELSGLSVPDFRRDLYAAAMPAASRPKRDRMPAPDARLIFELNRVGVNLNQIARNLNADRPERIEVSAVLDELRGVLNKLALANGP